MSKQLTIRVPRTARVYTLGSLSEHTRCVWLVLHGYGQLAASFIRAFEELDDDDHYIIAPEGLSRAYIGGKNRKAGASWMTSEMREAEIEDYLDYLDEVLAKLDPGGYVSSKTLIVLGFSQGTATASRWGQHTSVRPDRLVMVGGAPAYELMAPGKLRDLPLVFVHGQQDAIFGEANQKSLIEDARNLGWDFRVVHHKGAHHLDRELVGIIAEAIDNLRW